MIVLSSEKYKKKIILSEPSIRQKIILIINTNGALVALHMLTHFLSPLCHMSFHRLVTALCSFAATRDRRTQFLPEVALRDEARRLKHTHRTFCGHLIQHIHLRIRFFSTSGLSLFLCFFLICSYTKLPAHNMEGKKKGTQMVACLAPHGRSAPPSKHIHIYTEWLSVGVSLLYRHFLSLVC